ncbi:hypothetical protein [Pendulispora albinea]|uniref:Uncharacterized protein n=1 Tax=Pendulispora albinea TaxID=2741071 RepID=A0ABZ2LQC0_9BACT
MTNPFETYDIDPREGPRAITERFRELLEEAPSADRDHLRTAWEELTLHPARRLRAAFGAHPSSGHTSPSRPPPPRAIPGLSAILRGDADASRAPDDTASTRSTNEMTGSARGADENQAREGLRQDPILFPPRK